MLDEGESRLLQSWGITLSEGQLALIERYISDVLEYNRKVNITAAADEGEILRRHVLDGLAALPALRARLGAAGSGHSPRLADAGAGAGFVGIPLKIAWPEAAVTLFESLYRKYCFLNWTLARLKLAGARPRQARLPAGAKVEGLFDAVLARALAPLAEAAKLCLPAVRPGGIFACYQTQRPSAESSLERTLGRWRAVVEDCPAYRLPGESRDRFLVLIRRGR